ncbi:porin [Massilia sp. R2A-15]|uniref:porin n=1 Tax=Massilia sp. R2A-15 TaxID=3064278 RepID=UPI002735F888|nr:porin [Massilia sp. R2A-15]WLI91149.1 porin [Massilia sp. R2A-15]
MKMTSIAVLVSAMFGMAASASAATSDEVATLQQQMAALQQQMVALQNKLNTVAATPAPAPAPAPSGAAAEPLTAHVGGASVTLYGFADLSADATSNGKEHLNQVSSNLSYLGVRAEKDLGGSGLKAIAQVETLVNVSGTPTETSGLGSRNSYVGLAGSFGKIMLGKTDTPYKRATAMMDPFASSIGDYNTIMGNTGGDLRAEFDARIPHAIFYDSPKWSGFSINALYSPGQKYANLADSDKYAFAQGEKVCSGATPGSSGSLPDPGSTLCNDGAFTNAYSIAGAYEQGPLLLTLSYERHQAVDRSSDNGGVVSNESAAKAAVSFHARGNRLSAVYEKFYRNGGVAPGLNERARSGYYLSDVQDLGNGLDLMAAWAHAGQTPGGPDFGAADDKANMYAVGMKYHYDKQTALYMTGALLKQGAGAHYALGAGGHGTAIASPRNDAGDNIPGQTIKALSAGMQYAF